MNENTAQLLQSLQTVPSLLSELALSVAAAQSRLDEDYVRNLKEYLQMVASLPLPASGGTTPAEWTALLQATAPSRHQFIETTVEVRADLQMSTLSELGLSGQLGARAGLFAVTLNASYTRRNAYDHRAAATIRSVIHAVPPSPGLMERLLAATTPAPGTQLPSTSRYRELAQTFGEVWKTQQASGPPTGQESFPRPAEPVASPTGAATSNAAESRDAINHTATAGPTNTSN